MYQPFCLSCHFWVKRPPIYIQVTQFLPEWNVTSWLMPARFSKWPQSSTWFRVVQKALPWSHLLQPLSHSSVLIVPGSSDAANQHVCKPPGKHRTSQRAVTSDKIRLFENNFELCTSKYFIFYSLVWFTNSAPMLILSSMVSSYSSAGILPRIFLVITSCLFLSCFSQATAHTCLHGPN
jgi:hypothetical protein